MATKSNGQSDGTRWEGYSDYQLVSKRVGQSVFDAIESYALLQSAMIESASINPDRIAEARADILAAALRLVVEMQAESHQEEYQKILNDWEGEEGYLSQFQALSIQQDGLPGWVSEFVSQIRTAAWELGYLKAGRRAKEEPEDPIERDVDNMFQDI